MPACSEALALPKTELGGVNYPSVVISLMA